MNRIKLIAMTTIALSLTAVTAIAENSNMQNQSSPQISSQAANQISSDNGNQSGKIRIGETYEEHMNKENQKNAAEQAQQQQNQPQR